MIKYVIFDFDGTLADTKGLFVSVWNKLANKHGYKKIELDQIETIKKLSMKERCSFLDFPMYKIPIVMPELIKLYKHSLHEITLFDGIKNMLIEVRNKGCEIAIISSNSVENINNFLKAEGLENMLPDVMSSKGIFGKDRTIKSFLKTKNLKPAEIIYVGDEARDIDACKKCNVKVVWVNWGYDGYEVIQKANPDYMIKTPEEILDLI